MFTRRPPCRAAAVPSRGAWTFNFFCTPLGFILGPVQTKQKKQNSPEGQGRRTKKSAQFLSTTIPQFWAKTFNRLWMIFEISQHKPHLRYWIFKLRSIFRSKTGCDRLPSDFSQKNMVHKKDHKTEGLRWIFFGQISNSLITRFLEGRNTSKKDYPPRIDHFLAAHPFKRLLWRVPMIE